MALKPIQWFQVSDRFTNLSFHNPNPISGSYVICLNYKGFSPSVIGPWLLTQKVATVRMLHEWGDEPLLDQLKRGAQQMIDYAASDEIHGFQEGELYGVFRIEHAIEPSETVHLGLAYSRPSIKPIPVRGMDEIPANYGPNIWITPQIELPLQIEVRYPGEVIRRVSRYEREPVI